jgi:hypothetical protein
VGAIVGVLWSPSTPRTLTRNSGRITSLIQSCVVFTERVIHVAPSSKTEGQGKHLFIFTLFFYASARATDLGEFRRRAARDWILIARICSFGARDAVA